jgi:hypothetical protein
MLGPPEKNEVPARLRTPPFVALLLESIGSYSKPDDDDGFAGFFESLPLQLSASSPAPAATPPAMNLRRCVRLDKVCDQ